MKLKKYLSLAEVRADINAGNITLPQLTQYYLDRIEEHKSLNAFIEVFAEEAKARAIEVEQKMKAGNAGKLAGMVISIKDMICYKNHKVSASSKILEGFESIYS